MPSATSTLCKGITAGGLPSLAIPGALARIAPQLSSAPPSCANWARSLKSEARDAQVDGEVAVTAVERVSTIDHKTG